MGTGHHLNYKYSYSCGNLLPSNCLSTLVMGRTPALTKMSDNDRCGILISVIGVQ